LVSREFVSSSAAAERISKTRILQESTMSCHLCKKGVCTGRCDDEDKGTKKKEKKKKKKGKKKDKKKR
jgi:hypothetical protein